MEQDMQTQDSTLQSLDDSNNIFYEWYPEQVKHDIQELEPQRFQKLVKQFLNFQDKLLSQETHSFKELDDLKQYCSLVVRFLYLRKKYDQDLETELYQSTYKLLFHVQHGHTQLYLSQILQQMQGPKYQDYDIQVDWHIIYEAMKKWINNKSKTAYTFGISEIVQMQIYQQIVYSARTKFYKNASVEIFNEFIPLLEQTNTFETFVGLQYLSLLLPTNKINEDDGQWNEWVGRFFKIWSRCTMEKSYDAMWMNVLCRIASKDTAGIVDWHSYYPQILTAVLNMIKVPVGSTRGEATFIRLLSSRAKRLANFESSRRYFGKLLMYSLGSKTSSRFQGENGALADTTLEQFERLLVLLEDYYQPSVNARFTDKVSQFLGDLQIYFQWRLKRDIEYQNDKEYVRSFTKEERSRIAASLVKIAQRGQFSTNKTLSKQCIDILYRNAYIVPELVFPNILKRFQQSLESVSTVNHLSTSINSLAYCLRPIFRTELPQEAITLLEIQEQGSNWETFLNVVAKIMSSLIPGIDANDKKKTNQCMKFFSVLWSSLPHVYGQEGGPDKSKTEIQQQIQMPLMLEDYVFDLLEQIFSYTRNVSQRLDGQDGTALSLIEVQGTSRATEVFFDNLIEKLPTEIGKLVVNQTSQFILNTSIQDVPGMLSSLLNSLAKHFPKQLDKQLLTVLIKRTLEEWPNETKLQGVATISEHAKNLVVQRIKIISLLLYQLSKQESILKHAPQVEQIFQKGIQSNQATIRNNSRVIFWFVRELANYKILHFERQYITYDQDEKSSVPKVMQKYVDRSGQGFQPPVWSTIQDKHLDFLKNIIEQPIYDGFEKLLRTSQEIKEYIKNNPSQKLGLQQSQQYRQQLLTLFSQVNGLYDTVIEFVHDGSITIQQPDDPSDRPLVCGQRYVTVFGPQFYDYIVLQGIALSDTLPEFDQQVMEELSSLIRKFFFSYSDIKVDDFKNFKLDYLGEPDFVQELQPPITEENQDTRPRKAYEPFYILRKLNKLLQYRSQMNKHFGYATLQQLGPTFEMLNQNYLRLFVRCVKLTFSSFPNVQLHGELSVKLCLGKYQCVGRQILPFIIQSVAHCYKKIPDNLEELLLEQDNDSLEVRNQVFDTVSGQLKKLQKHHLTSEEKKLHIPIEEQAIITGSIMILQSFDSELRNLMSRDTWIFTTVSLSFFSVSYLESAQVQAKVQKLYLQLVNLDFQFDLEDDNQRMWLEKLMDILLTLGRSENDNQQVLVQANLMLLFLASFIQPLGLGEKFVQHSWTLIQKPNKLFKIFGWVGLFFMLESSQLKQCTKQPPLADQKALDCIQTIIQSDDFAQIFIRQLASSRTLKEEQKAMQQNVRSLAQNWVQLINQAIGNVYYNLMRGWPDTELNPGEEVLQLMHLQVVQAFSNRFPTLFPQAVIGQVGKILENPEFQLDSLSRKEEFITCLEILGGVTASFQPYAKYIQTNKQDKLWPQIMHLYQQAQQKALIDYHWVLGLSYRWTISNVLDEDFIQLQSAASNSSADNNEVSLEIYESREARSLFLKDLITNVLSGMELEGGGNYDQGQIDGFNANLLLKQLSAFTQVVEEVTRLKKGSVQEKMVLELFKDCSKFLHQMRTHRQQKIRHTISSAQTIIFGYTFSYPIQNNGELRELIESLSQQSQIFMKEMSQDLEECAKTLNMINQQQGAPKLSLSEQMEVDGGMNDLNLNREKSNDVAELKSQNSNSSNVSQHSTDGVQKFPMDENSKSMIYNFEWKLDAGARFVHNACILCWSESLEVFLLDFLGPLLKLQIMKDPRLEIVRTEPTYSLGFFLYHRFQYQSSLARLTDILCSFTDNTVNFQTRQIVLTYESFTWFKYYFFQEKEQQQKLWMYVKGRLADPKQEVRELACRTVSIFLKGQSQQEVERFVRDDLARAKILFAPQNKRNNKLSDPQSKVNQYKQMIESHACLLGFRAYVMSVNNGIGELIPEVLLSLVKAQNFPNPLGQTVKKTINDYKTLTLYEHPDDVKAQFQGDDWSLIKGVSAHAMYFA